MVKSKKILLIAYSLYVVNQTFSASRLISINFIELILTISRYMLLMVIAGFALYSNLRFKGDIIKFWGSFGLVFLSLINMFFFNGGISLVTIALIVLAYDKFPLEDIFKVTLITVIVSYVFVIISCKIGIISDTVSVRWVGNATGSFFAGKYNRHTMGFFVQNQIPAALLMCYIYLLVLKGNNLSVLTNAIFIILDFVTFSIFGARVYFILLLFIVISNYVVKYLKYINKKYLKKNTISFMCFLYPICCATSFVTALLYSSYNKTLVHLDNIFNNRLRLAHEALSAFYNLSLFGGGKTAGTYNAISSNTVDNGYILLFIQFGVVIGILIIIFWSYAILVASRKNNVYMLLALSVLAVVNMVDSHLTSYMVIPFYCIFLNRKDEFLECKIETSKKKHIRFKISIFKIRT